MAGSPTLTRSPLQGCTTASGPVDWAQSRHQLSPRENEVLDLWLAGYGIKRTSVMLAVHPSTVQTHRRSIVRKLGQPTAA